MFAGGVLYPAPTVVLASETAPKNSACIVSPFTPTINTMPGWDDN